MAITPKKVMQIKDGVAGGKLDSHVFYAQYIKLMKADFIGKLMSATIQNKPSFTGSGTAIYTRFFMPQLENYGDGSSAMREPVATRFTVSLSEYITAKYQFEDYDLNQLEASQFTSNAANGLAAATMAMWDAEVADLGYKAALVNKKYYKVATFSNTKDKAQMEADNLTLIDNSTDLTTIFNREKLGTSKAEIISLMNEKAKYRRLKGLGVTGGDAITNRYLSGEITEVAGWTIATHGFIGKKIDAGESFSLDRTYDFTKLECLTVNTETLAVPMGLNTIKDVRDPKTANDGIVAKISFGKGVIYPDLVMCFVNEYPTLAELNAAFKVIENRTDNKFSDESGARSAGYKLQGDSRSLEDEQMIYTASVDPMKELADTLRETLIPNDKTKKVKDLEKENEELKKTLQEMVNNNK